MYLTMIGVHDGHARAALVAWVLREFALVDGVSPDVVAFAVLFTGLAIDSVTGLFSSTARLVAVVVAGATALRAHAVRICVHWVRAHAIVRRKRSVDVFALIRVRIAHLVHRAASAEAARAFDGKRLDTRVRVIDYARLTLSVLAVRPLALSRVFRRLWFDLVDDFAHGVRVDVGARALVRRLVHARAPDVRNEVARLGNDAIVPHVLILDEAVTARRDRGERRLRGANRSTRVVGVFVPARDVRRPIRRRAHHRARVVTVIADVAVLAVFRGARALGREAASGFDNRKAKDITGVESARGDLENVMGAARRRHLEAFPETPVFAPGAAARAPDELHAADRPRDERVIHVVRNAANVYAELDLTTARAEERVRPGDDADARPSRIEHRHRSDERRHADGQRTDHIHRDRARTARVSAIASASRQQRRLDGRIRRSVAQRPRHDGTFARAELTRGFARTARRDESVDDTSLHTARDRDRARE